MKLGILTKQFNFRGGSSNYVYELSRRVAEKGHEVHIISNKVNHSEIQGVRICKIPVLKIGFFLKTFSFAWLSEQVAAFKGFDIIQGHGNNISQDILTVQNCYLATKLSQNIEVTKYNPLAMLERLQFKRGNYKVILTPSGLVKSDIINLYGVPKEDIRVIPRGVDSSRFNKSGISENSLLLKKKLAIPENNKVILFVSSGDFKNRGLQFLLKAVFSLISTGEKGLTVVVCGGDKDSDHPEMKIYTKLADDLGIQNNLIFTPFRKDIETLYAIGDMLVFPTSYDSFGQVVTEAMASGLPVIVSSKAGVSEIVTHKKNGLVLKDPQNTIEIASLIKYLLDPVKRKEIGEKGRALASSYTWDRVAGSMLEIYDEILDAKKRKN